MRLLSQEVEAIKLLFRKYFLPQDTLWLFGSRVDDAKKGGDIDLYIETGYKDIDLIIDKKRLFLIELYNHIGEQKIDVVINCLKNETKLPIYEIVRKTGIQIV